MTQRWISSDSSECLKDCKLEELVSAGQLMVGQSLGWTGVHRYHTVRGSLQARITDTLHTIGAGSTHRATTVVYNGRNTPGYCVKIRAKYHWEQCTCENIGSTTMSALKNKGHESCVKLWSSLVVLLEYPSEYEYYQQQTTRDRHRRHIITAKQPTPPFTSTQDTIHAQLMSAKMGE